MRNVALTGRLEYVGVRGLQTGVELLARRHGIQCSEDRRQDGTLRVRRALRARTGSRPAGEYAHVFISSTDALNDSLTRLTGIDPNIAEQLRGFYLEGSYRVLPRTSPHDAALFPRYENFDTQFRMPRRRWFQLPQFDRDAWVVGATYWVDPDVAIKFDYSHVRSQSTVGSGTPHRSTSDSVGGSRQAVEELRH